MSNDHASTVLEQLRLAEENDELPDGIAEKHDLGNEDDEE